MDWGKTARCCRRATDDELEAAQREERPWNCETCAFATQMDGLWADNAEAWRIFSTLCGRTVEVTEYRGRLLDRLTADWSVDELLDLLARLDLILDYLQPETKRAAQTSAHGQDRQDQHRARRQRRGPQDPRS